MGRWSSFTAPLQGTWALMEVARVTPKGMHEDSDNLKQ